MGKDKWILILIMAIAVITRLYGLELEPLSLEQKVSVILSISAGILSVVGLYFLVKEMFDEKLAAIASFLLAVSSWHVLVSKLGTKDILTSFSLIFAFYFIWHGLRNGRVFNFFLAGLFGGVGFYADKGYLVAPLVVLLVFWNYWDYLKKDFPLSKYNESKANILGSFSLLVLTIIAVTLPIILYVWQNPGFIMSAGNSVFSNPELLMHFSKNLGWITDKILLIEFGNSNLVSWPISIFFAIGFIKEFIHWLKRKHGHFSVVHTFVFSWLFIMLIPFLFSPDMPSILGLSVILPMVIILASKGLWWVIEKLNKWDSEFYPLYTKHWGNLDTGPFLALLALMLSIAILETWKLI